MDVGRVAVMRELLQSTGWVERTRSFATTMRTSTRQKGGLLLVGTPEEEPWHLAAHLDDESRYSGFTQIAPTLVRWNPPEGSPAHLSVTLQRLEAARNGETVFVVAEQAAPESLLQRVSDAKRHGATVLSLDGGDTELTALAHESLTVVRAELSAVSFDTSAAFDPEVSFDTVQHLVSVAAGEKPTPRGFRDKLARALDLVSGNSARW
jgi:hypothetical protein